ncbi:MAG TPA: aminodeoxychorismate lyase [Methylococcus sp.]|nr:aminodeoxychorismate lyase [Methylococcus sp.]
MTWGHYPPVRILVNGAAVECVEVGDRGFQYGDGIFTTLRVHEGRPLLLQRHLMRLAFGCERLQIPYPGHELVRDEVVALAAGQGCNGVIKVMITRGSGGRGYAPPVEVSPRRVVAWFPRPEDPESYEREGVRVRHCQTRLGINPRLAQIKHMNRLEQILARAEWDTGDFQEGLMYDAEDCLVEGTMSNVFLVRQGILVTPAVDRCGVAGVMRQLVMEVARESGMTVQERRIPREQVAVAEEMFLTNSVIGIRPVAKIEQRAIRVGLTTRELKARVDERTWKESRLS